MKRAVFLDRDGTLNVDKNYLSDPAQLEIIPGTGPALRRLMDAGFLLFIVTNQSGIGRGYYTLADMERVNERLCAELARDGVRFEKIYAAPEAPEQPSRGRKPSPQFLFDARDEFGVDLAQSYMIGDKLIDLECGRNAEVKKCVLVRTGYGAGVEQQFKDMLSNAIVVDDLVGAADWVSHESQPLDGAQVAPSTFGQRLQRLFATPIRIPLPKPRHSARRHLYVAGDGVHGTCIGEFDKFIPWSEVERVQLDQIKGRHGEPIAVPAGNKYAVVRQIRHEWQKHCPEACERDRRHAQRIVRFLLFVCLPMWFILLLLLEIFAAELKREKSFPAALRTALVTKLYWSVLGGIGISAIFWLLLWFGRSAQSRKSKSQQSVMRHR